MKRVIFMFSFAMLGFSALGQQASIPVEAAQNRRYAQMEVENEWEYADPQAVDHAVYGRGVDLSASHAFVRGTASPSSGSGGKSTPPETGLCTDPTALNYDEPLPCVPGDTGPSITITCMDGEANNYMTGYPCTYN